MSIQTKRCERCLGPAQECYCVPANSLYLDDDFNNLTKYTLLSRPRTNIDWVLYGIVTASELTEVVNNPRFRFAEFRVV